MDHALENLRNELDYQRQCRLGSSAVAALEWSLSEIERLRREVRYLRYYGNKDCTAMADEALTREDEE